MSKIKKERKIDSFSLYKNNDFFFKEKERAILRWIISAIVFYMLGISLTESNKALIVSSMLISIAYAIINTVRFFLITKNENPKHTNVFIFLDIIMVSSTLAIIPEKGAFLHPILLFLVVNTGLNYGHKIMLNCNAFVIFAFTFTVITNSYWQNNLSITLSVYLLMLLIPFYLIPIIKGLEISTYDLNEKAHKDHLTGLYNRSSIAAKLEKVFEYSRKNNVMSAVFYFDLDSFKKVNDQLGHKAGDELLVAVANNLLSSFRDKDLIFRVGGDEFVLISEAVINKEDAITIANKILKSVVMATEQTNINIDVTASIGIVCIGSKDIKLQTDTKKYITIADKAMYVAKKTGKSKYVFASPKEYE